MTLSDKKELLTAGEITSLFRAVLWESADYPERLYSAVQQSETVLFLREGDFLAGMMTAVSDGGMNVFFPYLLIHPDYQGRGLGKKLALAMFERYDGFYRKILVCGSEKTGFYEKCGMTACHDQCPMMKIG
ncbi:MAG: GNAT family N-acetyltransferase [Porcipelethomonas sp.]